MAPCRPDRVRLLLSVPRDAPVRRRLRATRLPRRRARKGDARQREAPAGAGFLSMLKLIGFNAFEMNCVGAPIAGAVGASARPLARTTPTSTTGSSWRRRWSAASSTASSSPTCSASTTSMAARPDAALRHAVQVPVNDPVLLMPAMAAVTEHLGFGVTCTLSLRAALHARAPDVDARPSDQGAGRLEHRHRYLDSAATGMGMARQPRHDQRYEIAEEYMEVMYKLWEGSWDDGAVVRDAARGVFADPARSAGSSMRASLSGRRDPLCEPSPQRTPVSVPGRRLSRGRAFAAAHAECVFINGPSGVSSPRWPPICAGAPPRAAAPRRSSCHLYAGHGNHRARPRRRRARSTTTTAGTSTPRRSLALFSGWTGVDFAQYRPDEVVALSSKPKPTRSSLAALTKEDPAGVDGAGNRRACRDRRPRAAVCRLAGADRRQLDRLGGGDRYRRLQPRLRGDAGELYEFVELVVPELQSAAASTSVVYERHLARKTVRRGPRLPRCTPPPQEGWRPGDPESFKTDAA